jgi:pentose-5-phosphate-3-epimerase
MIVKTHCFAVVLQIEEVLMPLSLLTLKRSLIRFDELGQTRQIGIALHPGTAVDIGDPVSIIIVEPGFDGRKFAR